MIPIKLTIQGLYSYQARQVIDFSRLNDARLFGVFGQVGAGKSAIIDAITLALYGEVERLNKQDRRAYNIMNLNANELYIEFEFFHGKEPYHHYKFIVKAKRNKKTFDDVYSFERTCYRLIGIDWICQNISTAESILGLSYEHFKRTIIIPQGKFQEFLQLSATERTKMMKEMFDLHQFDLSKNTEKLIQSTQKNIHTTEGGLAQIPEDTTEKELVSTDEELCKVKAVIDESKQKTVGIEQELKVLAHLKTFTFKKKEAETSLLKLKEDEENMVNRQKSLTEYGRCLEQFNDILAQYDIYHRRFVSKNQDLEQKKKGYAVLHETFQEKEKTFKRLDQRYKKMADFRREIEELERLITVKKMDNEHIAFLTKRKSFEQGYQKGIQTLKELELKQYELKREIQLKLQKRPDQTLIADLRIWFDRKTYIKNQLEKEKSELKKTKAEYDTCEKKKQEICNSSYFDSRLAIDDQLRSITGLITTIKKLKEGHEKEKCELEEKHEQLLLQEKLADYVSTIKDGKPCPLCGSEEHPEVLHLEDVSEKKEQFEKQLQAINEGLVICQNTIQELNVLEREISHILIKKDEKTAAVIELTNELNQHISTFKWEPFSPDEEGRIENLKVTYQEYEDQLKAMYDSVESFDKQYHSTRKELDELKEKLDYYRQAETELRVKKQTILRSFHLIKYDHYANVSEEEVVKNREERIQFIEQLEEKVTELGQEVKHDAEKIHRLQGEIQSVQKGISEAEFDLTKSQQTVAQRLERSDFQSIDHVRQVLASKLDVDKEKHDLESYQSQINDLHQVIKNCEEELSGKMFDEGKERLVNEQLMQIKEIMAQHQTQEGVLLEKKTRIVKLLDQKLDAEKKLELYQKRLENLMLFRKLFKANGFVNFISKQFLDHLVNTANDRFYPLTRNQLKLVLSEDNNFQIQDYLNNGKVRHIKTLSGGQLFQASFSMALALADHIKSLCQVEHNFFFLDEGFGTLDKESLEHVLESLRGLRHENRIVGLISHVEELQNDIDVHLRVHHDGAKGSYITQSV